MATLARAANLLPEGVGWAASGVLERRLKDSRELPSDWADPASPGHAWSRAADVVQRNAAALNDDSPTHWHARAGWARRWPPCWHARHHLAGKRRGGRVAAGPPSN
jgi:hypothetical protein